MLIDFNTAKADGKNIFCSNKYSKSGNPALSWKFSRGDSVRINAPDIFQSGESPTDVREKFAFACYVRSQAKFDGEIKVSFCKNEAEMCSFTFLTDFVGWRYIRILFSQMQGAPTEKVNNIKLTALCDGELCFDEIVTNYTDERFVSPSYQLPDLKETSYIDGRFNSMGFQSADIANGGMLRNPKLKAQFKPIDFNNDKIIERLQSYVLSEFGNCECECAKKAYEELNIVEAEPGIFTGARIETEFQRKMLKGTAAERAEFVSVRKCSDLGRDLAVCYKKTGDEYFKNAYIMLVRYMIYCGMSEGSILSSRHLLDYSLRPLYMSFILMKNSIDGAGLSDCISRLCIWYCNMERLGVYEGTPHRFATADDFNNSAIGFAAAALLMQNAAESSKWLFALKDWLDRNMAYSPGLLGIYKEDGSTFHHCGHYIAYGMPALAGVLPIVWALSETPYAISRQSWENTKNVLTKLKFSCTNGKGGESGDVPISFSCRHPLGNLKLDEKPFKYFALAAHSYSDVPIEQMHSGNVAMNMACAMMHRCKNSLVIMKGFSKYIWGNESYSVNNVYGRYSSYGAVEILGDTLRESGFVHEGYDFRHLGGTTAIIPSMEDFKQKVNHVDKYSGIEEMLISDQSFAGGVSNGKCGMFSMILAEHPKYNGTHRAIKSGVFIDDFVLLLGSNINNISVNPTETTLFQNYIGEADADNTLTDVLGNKYYVPNGQKVSVRTGKQVCPLSTGEGIGEGNFKCAVIEHGISPKNAQYEYAIGINGAECKEYSVIQKDDAAHIVQVGTVTFFAIYKPEKFCGFGEIESVDIPVLIITAEHDGIYICNPDLGLYDRDASQYDENGNRIEVSIYSRNWLGNDIASKKCVLKTKNQSYELCLRGGKTYKL